MKYILDTHIWIWWNSSPDRVSKKILEVIKKGEYTELLLSAISVWEFSKLVEKGRVRVAIAGERWIEIALTSPRICLIDLSPEISWASTQLPGSFHDDPADQIIVATARALNATILTADERISKYPHVRTVG